MNKTKEVLITGFALFSMFFGAGNLILPPFLGLKSGNDWFWVTIGFAITGVVIPILAIFAHARLQGTMFDFGKKVSPLFSSIYCFIVYIIVIALPAPRTAAVTHEMSIAPFFDVSSIFTSTIYFILVFIFAINRAKVLDLLGQFLTPMIIAILLVVIGVSIFTEPTSILEPTFKAPVISGMLEGYQTFDAIAGLVVGGVLIVSLNITGHHSFEKNKKLVLKAGIVAGLGLLLIYSGLIYSGTIFSASFVENASRTEILSGLSTFTLGKIGTVFLSVLVALACFTTAVGIITGTADYVKGITNNSQPAYVLTVFIGCVLGIVMGQFNVQYIIDVAIPTLMFIYPITIVLILLNTVSEQYASKLVFQAVVLVTLLFSIPDFLQFFMPNSLQGIQKFIPFSQYSFGWVLPAFIAFLVANFYFHKKQKV
ncbi:branched-chain amino acid transport system II carrier protein [Aureibaculum marinum]|uniref:Branched-chain amino acid transport system II carrier protein n=1 Tax=Aureibaculum marinum TaxID=2487930 RepID=A0A3N4NR45_9FLAO|nr:branched-chain amino acid transport system II carrier protein [Aureibaculum marinum]RPD94580.1 branched-chain amino acid transport system II carrier protein [Aureibaculum marinum]